MADIAGQLSDQFLQTAFGNLFGGGASVAPSQQGSGFLSSLLGSFGGFFADGGTLGAGKWGIAGEGGGAPELIHGPANITPLSNIGGMTIVQNIYGAGDRQLAAAVEQGARKVVSEAQGQQPRVDLERRLRSQ